MIIEPCKYCGETEHSKLSALTHVCDKDVLRERITAQQSMLMRIYENARGHGDSVHAVTRWEVDTVDYQALEDFLFPETPAEVVSYLSSHHATTCTCNDCRIARQKEKING